MLATGAFAGNAIGLVKGRSWLATDQRSAVSAVTAVICQRPAPIMGALNLPA